MNQSIRRRVTHLKRSIIHHITPDENFLRSISSSSPGAASPVTEDQHSNHQKINFYTNSNVLRYAELPLAPFSLGQLIFFGKILNRHGSNQDDLNHSLLQGANFVRHLKQKQHLSVSIFTTRMPHYTQGVDSVHPKLTFLRLLSQTRVQLPIRLARQIREFQSLPYIVTSNRYLTETYKIYVEAFEKIRTYPEIRCRNDNQMWCEFLGGLLNEHKVVIPKLAIGVAESASYLTNSQIEQFMTRMLHSRISRRVLAEHHIALTRQFQDYTPAKSSNLNSTHNMGYLGVIATELEVGKVVANCIQLAKTTLISSNPNPPTSTSFSPLCLRVRVQGETNAKFAYIPDHLEYASLVSLLFRTFFSLLVDLSPFATVFALNEQTQNLRFVVFELLLNAFRATMEKATEQKRDPQSMPIEVQIASSTTHITIRISDQAGGINYSSQSSYRPSFSSEDENESFPFTVSRRETFSFVNLLKTNHFDSNHNLIHLIRSQVGMEGKVHEQLPPEVSLCSSLSNVLILESPSSNNRSEEVQEARLRIGLPLSSIYAQFFGGSLEVNSIPGFSDIVLCIPKLGTTTVPN